MSQKMFIIINIEWTLIYLSSITLEAKCTWSTSSLWLFKVSKWNLVRMFPWVSSVSWSDFDLNWRPFDLWGHYTFPYTTPKLLSTTRYVPGCWLVTSEAMTCKPCICAAGLANMAGVAGLWQVLYIFRSFEDRQELWPTWPTVYNFRSFGDRQEFLWPIWPKVYNCRYFGDRQEFLWHRLR